MPKHRVLVLGPDSLFRAGLLLLLQQAEDVSVVDVWELDWTAVRRVAGVAPHIVIIVDSAEATWLGMFLTDALLTHHPGLLVIRVNNHESQLRLHAARQWPADLVTLLQVIQRFSAGGMTALE